LHFGPYPSLKYFLVLYFENSCFLSFLNLQNNFFKFADWPFSFKNLQIGPFVQILSRSSFHNTCQLITGSQAQVSAYKRPQSLQNHSLHANSSKNHHKHISVSLTSPKQIKPRKFKNSLKIQRIFKP
jgi:hypothetical protein